MTLASGDLTTLSRLKDWIENASLNSDIILQRQITACSASIRGKLNRSGLMSKSYTRVFDGQGTNQIMLPDYPVTSVSQLQLGPVIIQPAPLPTVSGDTITTVGTGYGYRLPLWLGALPGEPSMLEFVGGCFWYGVQNVKITYTAGYLISAEAQTVPATPFQVTVYQPLGVWCYDNGVTYANGTAFTAVTSSPTTGQYVPPTDVAPGVYTFSVGDANADVLISYSFVPADLEEACCQYVAERWSYRGRVGTISKSLGGQETVRFMRGGARSSQMFPDLPPEIESLIMPYVSVIYPAIGAPL